MVVIVDYGLGNLSSVHEAFLRGGVETTITNDIETIKNAKVIILPGVGAFRDAIKLLKEYQLIDVLKSHVEAKKPLIGICLGMQLLYEKSYEFGEYEGLGLIKGSIVRFDGANRVPHMGWNNLKFQKPKDQILKYIDEDDYVYFLHSYYVKSSHEEVIAYTEYGVKVPAIVKSGSVYGLQFHPEKSALVGANLIKALKEVFV